jgi:threonine aldolase
MQASPVGDDVFGEDPSINSLEEKTAKMFGFEAGLFCPSGTMTNQLAIKSHTQAGDEVISDEISHIYQYEGGGIAFNSGCSVRLLHGDRGLLNAAQIQAAINPIDVHKPITSLVSLENTSNRGGGACYDFNTFYEIQKVTKANQLALHLDGARVFNAIVHKKENAADYGKVFDSVSICLSKGLGAPVGSVLAANLYSLEQTDSAKELLAKVQEANPSYSLSNLLKRVFNSGWPASAFSTMTEELHPKVKKGMGI